MTIQESANPQAAQEQQPCVLILHAQPRPRERFATWLTDQGFAPRQADSVEQAVDTLGDASPDAMLLHAESAGESIGKVIDRCREARRAGRLPILVFDAGLDGGRRAELLRHGADEVMPLTEPDEELALRLHALLHGSRLREDLLRARVIFQDSVTKYRRMIKRMRRKMLRLRKRAIRDPLTRVYNGHYFRQWLNTQFEIALRYDLVLSVLMIDIDRFKKVNDSSGHPFGDFVLTQFADILRQQVRASDVVARIGGDEFAIGLVETGRQESIRFGRRLLHAVAAHSFEYFGQTDSITISIGQAGYPDDTEVTSAEQLLLFADQALYKAKENGRNDLACWHELEAMTRSRLAVARRKSPLPQTTGKPALDLMPEK